MNDAQTWTAIGGMLAVLFAVMAMMTRLFGHVLDAKLDTVNTRIDGLSESMTLGFKQVERRFERVDKRFEQVDRRLDGIDDDIQAITRRLMGGPDAA